MNITEDSFVGTWKGGPENRLSVFTIELKKRNKTVAGVWTIDAPSGDEIKRAMEIKITSPTLHGAVMRFNPNPGTPALMQMELVSENEAIFGPVVDISAIEKRID